MDNLREINIDTLKELDLYDRTMSLQVRADWMVRQRKTDREIAEKQERKIYNFKKRWKVLFSTTIYINKQFSLYYCCYLNTRTKEFDESFANK